MSSSTHPLKDGQQKKQKKNYKMYHKRHRISRCNSPIKAKEENECLHQLNQQQLKEEEEEQHEKQ